MLYINACLSGSMVNSKPSVTTSLPVNTSTQTIDNFISPHIPVPTTSSPLSLSARFRQAAGDEPVPGRVLPVVPGPACPVGAGGRLLPAQPRGRPGSRAPQTRLIQPVVGRARLQEPATAIRGRYRKLLVCCDKRGVVGSLGGGLLF